MKMFTWEVPIVAETQAGTSDVGTLVVTSPDEWNARAVAEQALGVGQPKRVGEMKPAKPKRARKK